jgi:hypothetical protein
VWLLYCRAGVGRRRRNASCTCVDCGHSRVGFGARCHGGGTEHQWVPPGQRVRYVFGFADLYGHLADWMGDAATCEFADPNATGDVHQRTTTGLAFWRKSTNTPTFTNGNEHWALTGRDMVYWTGSSIDPASDAIAFDASHPCLDTGGCRSTGTSDVEVVGVTVAKPPSPVAAPPPLTYATRKGPRIADQCGHEILVAATGELHGSGSNCVQRALGWAEERCQEAETSRK